MNRHLRKTVLATAAITAGLLLTACQSDSTTSSDSSSGKSQKGSAAVAGNAEGSADSGGSAKSGGSADSGNSSASGGSSASGNSSVSGNSSKPKGGVSGTFKNGVVTYLAPGKYAVSVPGKADQAFWVADDTEVHGAGTLCGDAQSEADAPCTLDQLEAATKKGAVKADVTMKDGVATLVAERRTTQQGVSGTWFGAVSYLAPGKYTVSDLKGVEQAFSIADDTKIWGAGDICGDANGQAATECTEAQLEAAAKKGFDAEVKIRNGVATTITEDH